MLPQALPAGTTEGGLLPLTPLEFLYYIGYSLKKRRSCRHRRSLPCTVVSIGNITVGGTGKTPAAIALAEEALARGFSPIVLTRGYKGRAKGPCFVLPRQSGSAEAGRPPSCSSAEDAGDEPMVMAERLAGVPVVKSADRYQGGVFALRHLAALRPSLRTDAPVLFILDDGFQHWKLSRDLDIVLIDGLDPFGSRKMLPLGPLREPLEALQRADMVVITKARNEEAAAEVRAVNPRAAVFFSGYSVRGIRTKAGGAFPVETLEDQAVYAFCGLANPESFRQTVVKLGARLSGFTAYRDHHAYTPSDIRFLGDEAQQKGCRFLVTTEKDIVKLKGFSLPLPLLCIEIAFMPDAGFYDALFSRIARS